MTAEPTIFLDGRVTLYPGDCLDVLDRLPENSVDSVVTDPPYHLTSIVKRFGGGSVAPAKEGTDGVYKRSSAGFMGKQWDGGDVAFQIETWRKILRVLKPGDYILAFASTRGFGRMSVALEDAGFITHPMLAWVFGSGFPKATQTKIEGMEGWRYGGQALKPAMEPIYMGQKPFSEKTGTVNIERWGTGAINIDGCRVATDENLNGGAYAIEGGRAALDGDEREGAAAGMFQPGKTAGRDYEQPLGRWPAKLVHDGSDEVLAAFPETGAAKSGARGGQNPNPMDWGNGRADGEVVKGHNDNGGSAARFFYTAKADAKDRIGSKHPTVKPLDLIQYLCRLVTPPGGTVLDPFAGTGTTGEAAWREGLRSVLIEREAEYQADIARRMDLAVKPTKRAAVAKSKGNLLGAEGTPLFGGHAA